MRLDGNVLFTSFYLPALREFLCMHVPVCLCLSVFNETVPGTDGQRYGEGNRKLHFKFPAVTS